MNWFQKIAQQNYMNIQDVLLYLQQNDQLGYFKYVKCNGEYRFAEAAAWGTTHEELSGNDIPESAAFINVRPDGFYVQGHSLSLKMGPDPADESNLSHLLSMPIINPYQ